MGTIDGGVAGGTVNVKVYSLTGSLVETLNGVPGSGTAQLNGAALSSGIYILVGEVKKVDGTVSENFHTKVVVVK
jgi:hypothetical protein